MPRQFDIFSSYAEQGEADNGVLVDPLGDLLLSVAAMLILAVILLLPLGVHLPKHAAEHDRSVQIMRGEESEAKQLEDLLQNRAPFVLLATHQGLRFRAGRLDHISADRILDDQRLSESLREAGKADHPSILFIEPDGLESAFLFDALARHMIPGTMIQIRLRRRCDEIRSIILRRLCSFEAGHVWE